mmetsp:Transcript_29676/g.78865  ORF Transcript_29676/g.78865 Transcript_29676/m.78865 type:complete len:409 (+) Transcript_29676:137-1363(+)
MPHPSSGSPGVKAPSTPPSNVPMPSYTACPQYATPSTPCVRTAPAQRPHAARPASTADSMLGGLRPQRQPRQGDRVAREVECVLEQHRDRHRADAARHRRDRPRHLLGGLKVHVADEHVAALVGRARLRVDAHVDDDAARLEPIPLDHLRIADGGDDNVSAAHVRRQVGGARVADGHGRVHRLQQVRDGHADDVRPAEHDHLLAAHLDLGSLQKLDAARRRARQRERRLAAAQAHVADVLRREAVDVLLDLDLLEDLGLVDVARQRQLDQNAVHLRVSVQRAHALEQLRLRDALRVLAVDRVEADLVGRALLHPHVGARVGAIADQHHRQPGLHAVFAQQLRRLLLDLPADLPCDRLTVDQAVAGSAHRGRGHPRVLAEHGWSVQHAGEHARTERARDHQSCGEQAHV